jgi:RNA ligase (TIGR02306 family)
MRQLASIQRIIDIQPIPDADSIDVATVLGWHVVIKKGEFKPGDKVIYVEIDSILPERPEFEFMRKNKFRVRTVRLRGQVSQGIVFPLYILPENFTPIEEGQDVTDTLGITKYEPLIPACVAGLAKGNFPSFIPKTDEPRIQICQAMLDKYSTDYLYMLTEKLDGCSSTIYLNNDTFGVCSRNLELKETPDNTIWKVVREKNLEEILRRIGKNIALQGELVGNGIQSNKYRFQKNTWEIYIFNIYDIDTGTYYPNHELIKFCDTNNIPRVPIVKPSCNIEGVSIDQWVNLVDGMRSTINPDVQAEGIVVRPKVEIMDPRFGRVSFKVINQSFLLKHGE